MERRLVWRRWSRRARFGWVLLGSALIVVSVALPALALVAGDFNAVAGWANILALPVSALGVVLILVDRADSRRSVTVVDGQRQGIVLPSDGTKDRAEPGGQLAAVLAVPQPAIWNVPPRAAAFIGRDALLIEVRRRLLSGPVVMHALHGWGGVGKTALAVEYAHLFADAYRLVWWVDAERPELIDEQLGALGVAAGWAAAGTPTAAAVKIVAAKLRAMGGWLVVFDNVPTPTDVWDRLPQGPGHVIVTSRYEYWQPVAEPIQVDVFSRSESVALLGRLAPALTSESADRISHRLGDLPLAITQAAGVIAATAIDGTAYLDELAHHAAQMMNEGQPVGYPRSLAANVRMSLDRLAVEDPASLQLLELCAMFAAEPVPLELFTEVPAGLLLEPLASAVVSSLVLGRCLTRLGRYGLVKVGDTGPSLHRLTQAVVVDLLGPDERGRISGLADTVLTNARPVNAIDPAWWPRWERLLPHLLARGPAATANAQLRDMAIDATWYQLVRGDLAAGHTLADKLYLAWRLSLGHDHPHTLAAAHNLARAYHDRGDYTRSHALDEDTLARKRRVLGHDHPSTLTSAISLAINLRRLGRFHEALTLDQDTLARCRRSLGDDHLSTLHAANSLANDLRALGRTQEALDLNQDTLIRRQRILGYDHPHTLASANNLANDLRALARNQEALNLDQDTFARRVRVLGNDHPDTQISASHLVNDLLRLGQDNEAQAIDEHIRRSSKPS